MNDTTIEWCNRPGTSPKTWNPIHFRRFAGSQKTGNMCTRISPGCKNCYASNINRYRGNGLDYTVENLGRGAFYLDEKELLAPLKTRKPCTIFPGDMFDLFHESIPDEMIQRVFGLMIMAEQHTFQVLTKRADRMHRLLAEDHGWKNYGPAKNIWLGVSVEDQQRADERIPLLLQTPATVGFLSVEPQLEAINLDCFLGKLPEDEDGAPYPGTLDWVICGGESGPGARPFNLAWAESLQAQCKAAGVAFFMKQVGSHVIQGGERRKKKDRKGADMHEWPHELRVREFPR